VGGDGMETARSAGHERAWSVPLPGMSRGRGDRLDRPPCRRVLRRRMPPRTAAPSVLDSPPTDKALTQRLDWSLCQSALAARAAAAPAEPPAPSPSWKVDLSDPPLAEPVPGGRETRPLAPYLSTANFIDP